MNIVNAKYRSKVLIEQTSFECEVDRCKVSFFIQETNLDIKIEGRKGPQKLEALLADIESLLFVYLGSFPTTLSICTNGIEWELTNRINKYMTSGHFAKKNLALCRINLDTVNSGVINKMRQVKRTPLSSLQYIVSESYEHVVFDHKITLLLHIVQGIVSEDIIENELSEAILKYSFSKSNKPGKYFAAAFHLCKLYFFNYHKKYNCRILQLLAKNQRSFLKTITDTRNWYSHFFDESKKPDRLKNGTEMMVYFAIIYYALRLMVLDKLELKPDEESVKEFYYSVHDWIAELYNKDVPLKSIAYTTRKMIEDINAHLQAQEDDAQVANNK